MGTFTGPSGTIYVVGRSRSSFAVWEGFLRDLYFYRLKVRYNKLLLSTNGGLD